MKTAASWWRVSTDDQKEISPDTQKDAARTLAEKRYVEFCVNPPFAFDLPPIGYVATAGTERPLSRGPAVQLPTQLPISEATGLAALTSTDSGVRT